MYWVRKVPELSLGGDNECAEYQKSGSVHLDVVFRSLLLVCGGLLLKVELA